MGLTELAAPPANSKSYSIPKLACDGTNWITWKSQTIATLSATCGARWHLERTACISPLIPTYPCTDRKGGGPAG